MDININWFKDESFTEMMLILSRILNKFMIRRDRFKIDKYPDLFMNLLEFELKQLDDIYDCSYDSRTGIISFFCRTYEITYCADIELYTSSFDVMKEYIVDSTTGEIIEEFNSY